MIFRKSSFADPESALAPCTFFATRGLLNTAPGSSVTVLAGPIRIYLMVQRSQDTLGAHKRSKQIIDGSRKIICGESQQDSLSLQGII
jgi:hypothetical protein